MLKLVIFKTFQGTFLKYVKHNLIHEQKWKI